MYHNPVERYTREDRKRGKEDYARHVLGEHPVKPDAGGYVLYTIGYGGRDPAELAGELVAHDVRRLLDVRLHAWSARVEWRAKPLAAFLRRDMIGYRHIEALGNLNYKNPAAVPRLKNELRGMDDLAYEVGQGQIAILCACRAPDRCHRSYIASQLTERFDNLATCHIP